MLAAALLPTNCASVIYASAIYTFTPRNSAYSHAGAVSRVHHGLFHPRCRLFRDVPPIWIESRFPLPLRHSPDSPYSLACSLTWHTRGQPTDLSLQAHTLPCLDMPGTWILGTYSLGHMYRKRLYPDMPETQPVASRGRASSAAQHITDRQHLAFLFGHPFPRRLHKLLSRNPSSRELFDMIKRDKEKSIVHYFCILSFPPVQGSDILGPPISR